MRGARRVLGAGFTLLEVLAAVAILGLGLTAVLVAQAGLFGSVQRSERLTVAVPLARCKMNELELKLLRDGYPQMDERDEGPCCEADRDAAFRCIWRVDRVELPEQPLGLEDDDGSTLGAAPSSDSMGKLQQAVQGMSGGSPEEGMSQLGSLLGESSIGEGMMGMVLTMAYPQVRPMFEASIRKLTVEISWNEGNEPHGFSVEQYVTNPQMGGLDSLSAEDAEKLGVPPTQPGGLPGLQLPGLKPGGIPGGFRP